MVASLRCKESEALNSFAIAASGTEQAALAHRAWGALLLIVSLLLRRLSDNTLLPGSIREEELDYAAHAQAAVFKASNEPVPSPSVLRSWASTMKYVALVHAMFRSLDLLQLPYWPTVQKRMVESFVLRGLDVIPRTDGIPADHIKCEFALVACIEEDVSPRSHGRVFCDAVRRKWRSNAVSSVLRARGVLQSGIAKYEQNKAEFDAWQRADIAMHGLRDCALPSCAKTEKSVKEFSLCAGCRSQVYCCLEHQALDWKAHKKTCKEEQAARRAEEGAEEEGADAGAAGA